ncbi:MAG: hypothetical protein ABGZ08_07675, partial [Akkermansiaceae bacterium]
HPGTQSSANMRFALKNRVAHAVAITGRNFPDFREVTDHLKYYLLMISLGKFKNDGLGSKQFMKC